MQRTNGHDGLSNTALLRRARLLGIAGAVLTLVGIGATWTKTIGEPSPPAMSTTRFSVAILAGPKQAAQTAPDNVQSTADAVVVVPDVTNAPVIEAQRSTSLPDAVVATPDAKPSVEVAQPTEVLPPARVAMPGGRLSTEDAPVGDQRDPFAIAPTQVFLRLLVNAEGRVVRGGIVRNGRDPMRDTLIYKAMASRTYTTDNFTMKLMDGAEPLWQLDLVIDYSTNEFLP